MDWLIKLAALRTAAYAKIFNYQYSQSELQRFLITPKPISVSSIKLKPFTPFFSQLNLLSFIPWIKLVALTGARAINNRSLTDDIDLMIVTAKNRLWLSRLLVTIILFPRLRRGRTIANRFCLNLWLDETALNIKTRNLYTAHEICQLKPLFDRHQTYQKFINANLWVKNYLANWTPALQGPTLKESPEGAKIEKRSDLIGFLDFLSFKFQYFYMRPKITTERVSRHFAFFHPRPTGKIILKKYYQLTRIVLVTGCFDVLHSEHKKFLTAAKKLGGILLVGLESDARVKKLKGPGRPVNSINQRITNLEKLNLADIVFSLPKKFNNLKDFRALINQIRPEILAVSASTPNLETKRKVLQSFGARVVIVLPHNPKISTTKMLKSRQ